MVAADRALLDHGQPQLGTTEGEREGDQPTGQPAAENGEVDRDVGSLGGDHGGLVRRSVRHDAQRRPRRARR